MYKIFSMDKNNIKTLRAEYYKKHNVNSTAIYEMKKKRKYEFQIF